MKPRQQRMFFVGVILAGVAVAATLAFIAMGKNMLFFYSPSQIMQGESPTGHTIRVGGLVVPGSVKRDSKSLTVQFDLTDNAERIRVSYTGILPDLFREGQGIVAAGQLNDKRVFEADDVLAKHDENYMPPEVAEALEAAKHGGQMKVPNQ